MEAFKQVAVLSILVPVDLFGGFLLSGLASDTLTAACRVFLLGICKDPLSVLRGICDLLVGAAKGLTGKRV